MATVSICLSLLLSWLSVSLYAALNAIASLSFLLCAFLLLECVAGWMAKRAQGSRLKREPAADSSPPERSGPWHRTPVAVLVPAHNEAAGLGDTLAQIRQQLKAEDRLVVVADNCTDTTAAVARKAGAITLERHHLTQRGKGYALDHGLKFLAQTPPAVLIMVDADTRVAPGSIRSLTEAVLRTQRPVQGAYRMTLPSGLPPQDVPIKERITVFATTVKNVVRLQGLTQLGLPVLLTGSGMAFPWPVLTAINLATGALVEDMKMGLDLALMGHDPLLCPEARFTAPLPQAEIAAVGQRTRWEHGRFATTRHYLPKLLRAAVAQRRLAPLALALDLCVLPLSLLLVLVVGMLGLSLVWQSLTGLQMLTWLSSGAGLCLGGAIALSWLGFGREQLPARQLLLVPLFVLWKLPIYARFLVNPQQQWVRTQRDMPVKPFSESLSEPSSESLPDRLNESQPQRSLEESLETDPVSTSFAALGKEP